VSCTPHRQGRQIGQREGRAAGIDVTGLHLEAQHRGDLEVDKLGRAEPFPAQTGAGAVAVRAVIAEGGNQDAGVNDDHDQSAA
jgi:hypothetical protein